MIPPWFQGCIYCKKPVIWRHQLQPFIFFMVLPLFHGSTWIYVKGPVFTSQDFMQSSIITSGLWLIQENLKGMFIWGKPLQPCSFKCAYSFQKTTCSNICLRSTLLNHRTIIVLYYYIILYYIMLLYYITIL